MSFQPVNDKTLTGINKANPAQDAEQTFREGQIVTIAYSHGAPTYQGEKVEIVAVSKQVSKTGGNKAFGIRGKNETNYRYQVRGEKGTFWMYPEDIE